MSIKQVIIPHTGGNSHTIAFKGTKEAIPVPKILESYVDDGGEICHILESGVTMSNTRYTALFGSPEIKGKVMPKGYKGENPDKTKIILK